MELQIGENRFLVDLEKTREYYENNSLCTCTNCRNFYQQAASRLPQLQSFLSQFGIRVDKPDNLLSVELHEEVQYILAAYSVCGKVLDCPSKDVFIQEGDLNLHITLDDGYAPNEQKTSDYFMIGVEGITFPWVLEEPFPS